MLIYKLGNFFPKALGRGGEGRGGGDGPPQPQGSFVPVYVLLSQFT